MMFEELQLQERATSLRKEFDEAFRRPPLSSPHVEDYLAIRVGGTPYAISVADVAGLHADKTIVPIPSPVRALRGLAGFRGMMAPVYDLGLLLGHALQQAPRWLVLVRVPSLIGLAFDVFEARLRSEGERQGVIRVSNVSRPVIDVLTLLPPLDGIRP